MAEATAEQEKRFRVLLKDKREVLITASRHYNKLPFTIFYRGDEEVARFQMGEVVAIVETTEEDGPDFEIV